MTKIIPSEVKHNTFDDSTFKKMKALLETIPSDYYQRKNTHGIKDLIVFNTDIPRESMLWVVAQDPAYFIQAKKDSSAIFRIEDTTVIAFRPKFIEYPQIADIPYFAPVTQSPYQVALLQEGEYVTEECSNKIKEYILGYYTANHAKAPSPSQFQTQLLTSLKHKVSRESGSLYWHLILDTKNTQVSFFEDMKYRMVFRIEGPKTDKCLFMFSQKGVNNPVTKILKDKWRQLLTFLLLFLLLMTVVMCPAEQEEKPAYCANKSTVFYIIGGFFMLMVGMKVATRKKKKLPGSQPQPLPSVPSSKEE